MPPPPIMGMFSIHRKFSLQEVEMIDNGTVMICNTGYDIIVVLKTQWKSGGQEVNMSVVTESRPRVVIVKHDLNVQANFLDKAKTRVHLKRYKKGCYTAK